MWDLITLAQCLESKMSPGLFRDFMDVYIRPSDTSHLWLNSLAVVSVRLDPMGSQFSRPIF